MGNIDITHSVLYDQQTLTEEQKRQARENIDAGEAEGTVHYDQAQDLTEDQKQQARTNIGVSAGGVTGSVLYNEPQSLSDEQKQLARVNIGAAGTESEIATNSIAENLDNIIKAKLMVVLNLEKHYKYRGKPLRTYGIGYYTIKPTFGTAATITFSYKVNTYSFVFDIDLDAADTVFTFKDKFKTALTTSLSYLGVVPNVILLDDGTGIQFSTDTDIEVEINTIACSGAALAEVSDHPTTAPAFIGQLYHNTNKKKEWEGKSVLTASDWYAKY